MLEMCRNLEEENAVLNETVNSLKEQLAESKRESAACQLIPHYRLAIVRSRSYAASLLEQIRREQVSSCPPRSTVINPLLQATSQSLREQLEETYHDLKKVFIVMLFWHEL
jgi:phosphoenolpyruvate-protein kinase (PTS system EI component)